MHYINVIITVVALLHVWINDLIIVIGLIIVNNLITVIVLIIVLLLLIVTFVVLINPIDLIIIQSDLCITLLLYITAIIILLQYNYRMLKFTYFSLLKFNITYINHCFVFYYAILFNYNTTDRIYWILLL